MSPLQAQRSAFASVAAGIVLRAWALYQTVQPVDAWAGDSVVYRDTILGFLRGRIDPDLWVWTPGYPLLCTPLAALLGAPAALHVVSFVAGSAVPLLAFLAGRALGDPVSASVAALALAFSPEVVLASTRPLSDSVALALLLLSFWLLLRHAAGVAAHSKKPAARGARRRGHAALGLAGAGLVAGLAALSRPESLIAVPILPFLSHGRRPSRAHAVFLVSAAAAVLPYVIGLRRESGVWGLSLKPAMNLLKLEVYERSPHYYRARAAWAETMKSVSDANGELIPRKLAEAAAPFMSFDPGLVLERWFGHLRVGLQQTRVEKIVLAVLGIAGLVLPGPLRPRLAFAVLSLPFAGVPLFVNPIGRFVLPALPGHAWGLGRLLQFLAKRVAALHPRAAAAAIATGTLLVAGRGIGYSHHEAGESTQKARLVEIEAAINEEELERAERLLGHFLRKTPKSPTGLLLRGRIEDVRGDDAAAEATYREAIAEGASPLAYAEFLMLHERLAEADSVMQRPGAKIPDDVDSWTVCAHIAFRLGRFDDALQAFTAAERIEGPTAESQFNIAIVLDRLGRLAESRACLERVAASGNPALADQARAALKARDAAGPGAPQDTSNFTP